MTLISALALFATPDAAACGGFACDQAAPVLQAAERIVFGVDELRGEVEMHVQITYAGDATEFAWIVPTPQQPDLFLTTASLFTQVATNTLPTFTLNVIEEGNCRDKSNGLVGRSMDMALEAAPSASSGGTWSSSGVNVVDKREVGPYDTVTLQATSTEALMNWLAVEGYDIPASFEDVLAPYLEKDAFFVALKLAKDSDVGDLAPLGLRYDAKKAIIPVQLTAVSALPDMRLETYVFSDGRGVPESYLHVTPNDAAINWWNQGANYDEVITLAADEAGGHAFATDYFGRSDIAGTFFDETSFDEGALRAETSISGYVNALRGMLMVTPPELFAALEDAFGLAVGDGANVWNCPDCVEDRPFDPHAATDVLMERVIEPLRGAQGLVDRFPRLSRMTSSLDAAEMTVDPTFVQNKDMVGTPVSLAHAADFIYECGNGRLREKAPRTLVLADGREIEIPSENWISKNNTTEFKFIRELGDQKAQRIEQMGAEGQPLLIADYTEDFAELAILHNRMMGCSGGCSSTGAGGASIGLGLLGLALVRRRRS